MQTGINKWRCPGLVYYALTGLKIPPFLKCAPTLIILDISFYIIIQLWFFQLGKTKVGP